MKEKNEQKKVDANKINPRLKTLEYLKSIGKWEKDAF